MYHVRIASRSKRMQLTRSNILPSGLPTKSISLRTVFAFALSEGIGQTEYMMRTFFFLVLNGQSVCFNTFLSAGIDKKLPFLRRFYCFYFLLFQPFVLTLQVKKGPTS